MTEKTGRAGDWLAQAEDDLKWAGSSFRDGHLAQTCFICQQVAEKALKAVALLRGYESVRGHSVAAMATALAINDEILDAARRLDQYYITARYPDALPAGAPFELFTLEQAKEAIGFAERVLTCARTAFAHEQRDSGSQ